MYTSGYTRQQFEADPRTVDAVIRNFIVMGEAAKNIPAEVRQLHPEIPCEIWQASETWSMGRPYGRAAADLTMNSLPPYRLRIERIDFDW